MTGEIISHRLDLAVRLRNAVTGNPVMDRRTMFWMDGRSLRLKASNGTEWIGVDTGRNDFVLGVNVRGFEKAIVPVRYEILDPMLPMLEIPLIPEQNEWNKPSFATLEGSLDKIEELQAVPLKGKDLYVVSYQEETGAISLYNPHKKVLRLSTYAVVDEQKQEFEIIRVSKALPDGSWRLDGGLKRDINGRRALVRPVYGTVSGDGNYLIRIPRSREGISWIIRYIADGQEYFRTTDLLEPIFLSGKIKRGRKKG